ncbi:MAG: GerMN domain-containing protein [Oscillospiraceae bacterium]|nr:GerMN domain-containing protein [Oscillospiraceae bacterium]
MRRMLLSLVLALSLLLAGCGTGRESSGALLYFCTDPNDHSQLHGPAIQSQPYLGPSGPGVEELVSALLAGPTQDGLVSPFPQGLSLQSWALEDGLLTLNFSEQYGGLADISLTLADYCLVLTLSQVEGVDTVQIQSAGHTYHSRSHQTMKADEVLTDQSLPEEVLHPSDEEN